MHPWWPSTVLSWAGHSIWYPTRDHTVEQCSTYGCWGLGKSTGGVSAFSECLLSSDSFDTSNSNQVSQNAELLQYQHPGFLAFMEALLFDTKMSLGANNPGSFSTFRSGFIALGATWVSIHYPRTVPLTRNFEIQVTNEVNKIRTDRGSGLFVVEDLFDIFSLHHSQVPKVRTKALTLAFEKVIMDGT